MRVILTRLSALGDVVHTWPLAEALRSRRPAIHLTWVVEEPLRPLVAGHPAVDAVLTVATRRWRRAPLDLATRHELGRWRTAVRELEPDCCLDPQGTAKSALLCRLTGARRRVGLSRPWRREILAGLAYTETLPGPPGRQHVVAANLEFVRCLGLDPPSEGAVPDGRWLLEGPLREVPAVADSGDAIVLPQTGGAGKDLPVETLAEVARGLAEDGLRTTVAWGPGEIDRARAVVELCPNAVLAPPTSILELAGLFARAAVVVGGDTGPVHLAASLGTPTVAVFLTTDAVRNRPLGARTAVVSGARPQGSGPTGSARARPERLPPASEVLEAARSLLATGSR